MNKKLLIRKTHRYLGLFIGIQFLLWTLSGLYFSWMDLDFIHGDHLKQKPTIEYDLNALFPPNQLKNQLPDHQLTDSAIIQSFNLVTILNTPYYLVTAKLEGQPQKWLFNAKTGEFRPPLTVEEAVQVAKAHVVDGATTTHTEWLSEVGNHHEVRGRALPLVAIDFTNPDFTAYVDPATGQFQTVRHTMWRVFDFLWMFHTMDYVGRDDFNNWLLKLFSIGGLLAVISGFWLFFISRKKARK